MCKTSLVLYDVIIKFLEVVEVGNDAKQYNKIPTKSFPSLLGFARILENFT